MTTLGNSVKKKPRIFFALRLRCPYCGKTPLLKKNSWIYVDHGCKSCNFRFERELGYFNGGTGMVLFPIVSILTLIVGFSLIFIKPDMDALIISSITSLLGLVLGVLFYPFSMALWLYWEHANNPINDADSYDKILVN